MANMGAIKTFISATMGMIKALWTIAWNGIKAVFTPIINGIKSAAMTVFNGLKSYFTTVFNFYKSIFTSVFGAIKSTVTTIFNGIKSAMEKPLNSAKSTISGIVNSIKRLFTSLVLKIPKPKIPIVNVGVGHKTMAGVSIPYPKISFGGWRAKGGLFDQPELVGIGEKGREAIIPLENRKYFKPFATAIAENIARLQGGGTAAAAGTTRLEVPVFLNNREILRAIIADLDKALAKRAARTGGLVNRGNL
jgi:phage-related protein